MQRDSIPPFLAALILLLSALVAVTRSERLLLGCFYSNAVGIAAYIWLASGTLVLRVVAVLLVLLGTLAMHVLFLKDASATGPKRTRYFEISGGRLFLFSSCALLVAAPFALLKLGPENDHSSLPYGVAVMLLGVLTIATRVDRITQGIGLITVENGVVLASVSLMGQEVFSWLFSILTVGSYILMTTLLFWVLLRRTRRTSQGHEVEVHDELQG